MPYNKNEIRKGLYLTGEHYPAIEKSRDAPPARYGDLIKPTLAEIDAPLEIQLAEIDERLQRARQRFDELGAAR
jgi:hypothetical protein